MDTESNEKRQAATVFHPGGVEMTEDGKAYLRRVATALDEAGYDVILTDYDDEWFKLERMERRGVICGDLAVLAEQADTMSRCDVVYFCYGWTKDKNCRALHELAEAFDLMIIEEETSTEKTEE